MFTILNNQFDAFALPFAKKKRDRIIAELTESGIGNVYEEGRHVIVEDSRGNRTTIQFSEDYVPEKVIKPSGIEYGFEYDEEDRLITFLLPGGERIEWVYEGGLLNKISFNKKEFAIKYNQENRVTAIIYPDRKRISFIYDNNKIGEIINRSGNRTVFKTELYKNDLNYKLIDPLGRSTKLISDQTGNITKILFSDNTIQETKWHKESLTKSTLLRNGLKKVTEYTDKHISKIRFSKDEFVSFTSDKGEKTMILSNENGIIKYSYNNTGRVNSESFQNHQTKLSYDETGFLTEMLYGSGLKINYQYNADGDLESLATMQHRCKFVYASNDTIESIDYPNQITEFWNHQVLSGTEQIVVQNKWGELLSRKKFGYDNLDRLIKYDSQSMYSVPKSLQIDYNDENNLTHTNDLLSNIEETYHYDVKGNMTFDNGAHVKIGIMDQPLFSHNNPITYDSAGNVISFYTKDGFITTLNYNKAGKLASSETKGTTWMYEYDAIGRRICKSSAQERFDYRWVQEKLTAEIYIGAETVLREYIYNPYSKVPLGFVEGGKIYWLHKDRKGAVYGVTDDNGNMVWFAEYDAFGAASVFVNKIRQPWRLAGQYSDEETGLYYHLSRYYSPWLKIYLSQNPCWYNIEASNYSYALNNPLNRSSVEGTVSHPLSFLSFMISSFIGSCLTGTSGLNIGELIVGKKKNCQNKKSLRWAEAVMHGISELPAETYVFSGGSLPVVRTKTMMKVLNCLITNP